VRQRLRELRRRRPAVFLELERENRERPEEVRADETQRRPPERKDHERDRDPSGALGQPREPLRRDREAERRTADPCERAPQQRVPIPVPRNVDAHRIRSRRRLAHREKVETYPRTTRVERDAGDGRTL